MIGESRPAGEPGEPQTVEMVGETTRSLPTFDVEPLPFDAKQSGASRWPGLTPEQSAQVEAWLRGTNSFDAEPLSFDVKPSGANPNQQPAEPAETANRNRQHNRAGRANRTRGRGGNPPGPENRDRPI